jgi:hypothetical protein
VGLGDGPVHNGAVITHRWARPLGLAVLWTVAAALAVAVGVLAVTTVGDSLRDRGPLGNEEARADLREEVVEPDESLPLVERTIREEFGELDVACRGAYALGIAVRPHEAGGWETVSFESGPDDDVDAVFAHRGRSIEIEVYCDRGEPTIGDLERNELPESD